MSLEDRRKMFAISKKRLLESMAKLQRSQCSYDSFGKIKDGEDSVPPYMCDCKYGFDDGFPCSENNGCPELRLTCHLLARMTDEEYDEILGRTGNIIMS